MIATWVDYSFGAPSGAALAGAGITGVLRYVGIGSSGKRLTAVELADLTAHGIQVLGVAESTSTEADNGYGAGQADARAVLADPVAANLPYIFATNDKPSYNSADVAYVRGYASVLGARAGAYGFASFLEAVRATGAASVFWQAGDPPNMTGTEGWVHFWQRQGTPGNGTDGPATPATVVVGGVSCDLNNQLLPIGASDMAVTDPLPVKRPDGTVPTVGDALGNLYIGDYYGGPSTGGKSLYQQLAALSAQVTAIQGALSTEEADLLAAIKTIPADQSDPAAVAAGLIQAGLPAQVVTALLAVLNKAATPTIGGTTS